MAQATYRGQDFSVTFEASPTQSDFGVSGFPVWTEYEDPTIVFFEFLGYDMPVEHIPDNVYDALLKFSSECEDWE